MSENGRAEVVVVTGASAGIGRAIVREYAQRGARIGLLARGRDGLEAARDEVEQAGGRGLVLAADVADFDQVEAAAAAVEKTFGPIDVWVNNAMVSVLSPARDMTPREFRRITEVTYLGYVWGTLAALHRMLPRDRGCIVQVGSALAYRAIPLQSAYCAAKHAIVGFTSSVRCELLHDGSNVKITMVHLPGVNTPQFEWIRNRMPNKSKPLGAIFQPEVAARAVVWAAGQDRREVFVGGPTLQSVLADRVAPALLDRHLAKVVYEGHQTDEPDDPERPDNLWYPVPGDHGAHGPFDEESRNHSVQLWASKHRRLLGIGGVALAGAAAAGWLRSRNHV